jgi:hypothetical protein
MKIVIPSYGRPDNVKTKEYFKDAYIVVPNSQKADYEKNYTNVIGIDDQKDGFVAKKRNACLEVFNGEEILLCDDDIITFFDIKEQKNIDSDFMLFKIQNAFVMARELGCNIFGFAAGSDKMKYKDFQPFSLTKQFYWVIGILGNNVKYDENLRFAEDIDFWLQNLNKDRKTLRFNKYFPKTSLSKKGGIPDRKLQLMRESYDYLINKWGSKIVGYKNDIDLYVNVPIKGI